MEQFRRQFALSNAGTPEQQEEQEEEVEDVVLADWDKVGRVATQLFAPPSLNGVGGAAVRLEVEATRTERSRGQSQARRARRAKAAAGPLTKPHLLSDADKAAGEETNRTKQSMHALASRVGTEVTEVDFADAFLDKNSFANSVENLLTISLLVKSGDVGIAPRWRDFAEGDFAKPPSPPGESTGCALTRGRRRSDGDADRDGGDKNSAFVLTFDMVRRCRLTSG